MHGWSPEEQHCEEGNSVRVEISLGRLMIPEEEKGRVGVSLLHRVL